MNDRKWSRNLTEVRSISPNFGIMEQQSCTVGTEIYWHGILDYDNRDNRRLQEIGEKFKAISVLLKPIGNGEVIAVYDSNYYEGKSALIKNQYRKGTAYYFGGAFNEETASVF